MDIDLHGIFVPLATPFDRDGEVNRRELRRLVAALSPHVDGFVANGTTGDFPLLSLEERERVLRTVLDAVRGTKIVIAGVGAISTWEATHLAVRAQDLGADATLVVKPYYVRPTSAGLRDHFLAVANAVPTLPMLLYNFPKLMGQEIPAEVVGILTQETDNVVGMKDSSGQLPYTLAVLEATPSSFSVLVGHGALMLPAIAMGASGVILAAANLIPHAYRAMYEAVLANAWAEARALQSRIHPVAALVSSYGSLTVRAGLTMLGFDMGEPRQPLSFEGALSREDQHRLHRALEDLSDV
ncbi:MAG: dihydrodipicolinate synthase family protein [Anaerolineae bacterium]